MSLLDRVSSGHSRISRTTEQTDFRPSASIKCTLFNTVDRALHGDAQYYSASMAGCEVLYVLAILCSLGFEQKRKPAPAKEDSACIKWGNSVIGSPS